MAMLTVGNLPDDVRPALRVRTAQHGRSTDAEVRDSLENVVKPEERLRMGDALGSLGRALGLMDKDVELLSRARDTTPANPMRFE